MNTFKIFAQVALINRAGKTLKHVGGKLLHFEIVEVDIRQELVKLLQDKGIITFKENLSLESISPVSEHDTVLIYSTKLFMLNGLLPTGLRWQ